MSKLTGKELAEEFSNFVNNYNCNKKEFVDAFFRQHRTLQQSMFGLMFKVIEKAASGDIGTDPRNQSSIDTCKKVVDGFKKEFASHLIAEGWDEEKAKQQAENDYTLPSNLPHI